MPLEEIKISYEKETERYIVKGVSVFPIANDIQSCKTKKFVLTLVRKALEELE